MVRVITLLLSAALGPGAGRFCRPCSAPNTSHDPKVCSWATDSLGLTSPNAVRAWIAPPGTTRTPKPGTSVLLEGKCRTGIEHSRMRDGNHFRAPCLPKADRLLQIYSSLLAPSPTRSPTPRKLIPLATIQPNAPCHERHVDGILTYLHSLFDVDVDVP